VLIAQASAPFVVHVFYSAAFRPAAPVLAWQMFGTLFKFLAWTFSFVVLARSRSVTYFAIELAGGLSLLAATWVGMRTIGLEGTGVGFVGGYGMYALVVWSYVRRRLGLSLTTENLRLLALVLFTGALLQLLPHAKLGERSTPVALVIAVVAALLSATTLYRETRRTDIGPSFALSGQPSGT
jgi:antigen flippase